jgi:hypothetical protein
MLSLIMMSVHILFITMLSVIMLNVVMLSVIMLSVVVSFDVCVKCNLTGTSFIFKYETWLNIVGGDRPSSMFVNKIKVGSCNLHQ